MIEVPPDLLNIVFTLLIVVASVNRSRQRYAGETTFDPPDAPGAADPSPQPHHFQTNRELFAF